MKKMMTMAFAAAMTMMMSANAMAASSAPSTATEMAAATEVIASGDNNTYETRSMLSMSGDRMFKFDYVLDAEGTVISKTMYMNINNTNNWAPVCTYRADYSGDSNKMIYAGWNKEDNAFTSNATTITYSKEECPIMMRLPEIINY